MPINRRYFIKDSILAAGAFFIPNSVGRMGQWALHNPRPHSMEALVPFLIPGVDPHLLTVYHTAHHNGELPSLKGMQQLRAERIGMLLDAGQFLGKDKSFADHREMITVMNKAGYHGATLGENELNMDPDQMAELSAHMRFPLVSANLSFGGTPMSHRVSPYIILPYGSYKIGITGVGDKPVHAHYKYQHPAAPLTQIAKHLRAEGCHLVVCLSQLPHLSDQVRLARSIAGVDLMLAANKASFQTGPYIAKDANEEEVAISQGCSNGSYLRHLHLSLQMASIQFPA